MKDYTGEVFGRLTVLGEAERVGKGKKRKRAVTVKCSCGLPTKVVELYPLTSGITKSCGCFGKEQRSKSITTHGMSSHPLYAAWVNIKGRCFRTSHPDYKNYGGRGISLCVEWKQSFKCFSDFCLSNGWCKGLDIDRENNDLGYSPTNIRFVSRTINLNNTRVLKITNTTGYRGVTKCREKFVAVATLKPSFRLCRGGFSKPIQAAICRDNFIRNNNITTPMNFTINWKPL